MSLNARIYNLSSGQYQISYRNPVNGKRKRHKFSEERAAKAYREDLERQFHSKNIAYFTEIYVGQLIEKHLKEWPESRLTERKSVFRSFCDHFSRMKVNEMTRAALKTWFQNLKEENDYSDRTMNSIKTQINHLFRFLIEEGYLSQSPLEQIKFKRVVPPRRSRIVLSVDEVKAILSNAEVFSPDLLFPYLSCVAHTGARREEIIRLNREDLDFATGLIHLKKTKNGRERFVRMSPVLESILKAHLAKHTHQAVFCNDSGKRLNSRGEFPKLMNKFKAFFPVTKNDWGCHSLRHSFAYNFLKKGGQMYQLQAILGHRSIDVTVDLYGQLQAQDIECPSPYESNFSEK